MIHRTRLRLPLLMIAALLVPATAAPVDAPAAGGGHASIDRWATEIWEAALRGNDGTLRHKFDDLPADAAVAGSVDRFRDALAQLRANAEQAAEAREEQRAEALGEMRDELEQDRLAQALRKAVKAQTLAEDFDQAFDEPEIMELVAWAESEIPRTEDQRLWLDAQELLYLLRTFYEDTERRDEFDRYDKQLEAVNRRVGLLAQYAPRRLHEMRNERRARIGEEPLGEYNPATALDWEDRLDGIDQRMLRAALGTAAAEHIETAGWRPLLEGGLEALRLFATTTALSEAFPALIDDDVVDEWVAFIDGKLESLTFRSDEELDRNALNRLLDDLVEENMASLDLPLEVVYHEFGEGAMAGLDPYSEIIWPAKLARFRQATQGNFVGVGILIRHNDKREIKVVNPLEGTPAYFAGIKPNDLIMEVNGDSTVGWSLNDAVDRITGPKGEVVTLGVEREGVEGLLQIPVERDVIKIRSVKGWWKERLDENGEPVWDWYLDPVSRIAYIRLTQFTEDSWDDLLSAWREINADGEPNGLVLDLRYNPGGLLTAAVRISNLFVRQGNIVTGEDKFGRRAWRQDARAYRAAFADIPTVILVNQGSASASEIVAGCLQAHGACVVVGKRTFGKGSVQTVHYIARNGRLKLTTQYYRLPSPDGGITPGRLVHKRPGATEWGVDPDIEVDMTAQQNIDAIELRQAAEIIPLDEEGNLDPDDPDRPDVNDLLVKGIDPQLEMAVLILQAQALARDQDVRQAARPED
ncbi:MAG: S41 family peptidase [Planctomycetota bacterium]|nr:S41 family peptidase [Planctomycetota bacterium]